MIGQIADTWNAVAEKRVFDGKLSAKRRQFTMLLLLFCTCCKLFSNIFFGTLLQMLDSLRCIAEIEIQHAYVRLGSCKKGTGPVASASLIGFAQPTGFWTLHESASAGLATCAYLKSRSNRSQTSP